MIPGMEYIDEATMAADKASVDAVVSDIEAAWAAQVALISEEVGALPTNQKGRFLAPIARLPIGEDLRPEGLSEWGEQYFENILRQKRVAALKPLY